MGGPKRPEQERCDAILAAAYQIALTDGLDAVTARRVATAAGISPGLVFFPAWPPWHRGTVSSG
ncbi:TetR family transcriptional regulator [Cryobacterium adonitolivorans]|uniref:TetR family transcriptional regulator n=1 Tax=Cryobacterium adonitolivorans TaxID=1259189 RepID=A0A4R8WE04_9MICO|nr:TetR family transcriptional regulator [Cryobacterium adonitolivorans]TFC07025.1 TetR family transcriptional regulator [Cryobacterium adonitolivorans]